MITLEKIMSSNLELLKEQEAELLKSLDFVRKARQVFAGKNQSAPAATPSSAAPKRRRRRKSKAKAKPVAVTAPAKKAAAPKAKASKAKKAKAPKAKAAKGGATRMDQITAVMKAKNAPMATAELVDILFKQQTADKDLGHFRQLIYTTLTGAYKKGTVVRKDGMISLGK
jgi:hypothetical protein